ncbi:response regulator transcription factor [Conyzicola nivalis]|uniref:Helix-turn-helix transcriptional regulator n=1 Tax=Conyzicola nivalis TaxID=1477021 RepID=A0A916WI79_9MICO|nr:LuxR C-terminal-related transcriptional regulator [Conyzicola nivalis]GGB02350.1 helix-turn-helix transcriptional regulator [Conyzicola nivalis]
MPSPTDDLLDDVRGVISQSLLGIAAALSDLLRPMVPHEALVIFTEDCTGRPQKKAGAARIVEHVTIAELDELRGRAAGLQPARFEDATVAGGAHPVVVFTADTAAILVLVDVDGAEIADDTSDRIARIWQLVALSIRQQVATASPAYLADSRSASRERASLIADLTDAHATALESLLVVLRSPQHGDAAARQRATDIAAGAMVSLRAVSDRDRLLAEEPVHSAFERLRDDLAPLVRHGGLDVEFVPPPPTGRPLPGEVAHAARAVVRGAVLALSDADGVDRVRIQWDCDGSNLLVDVRDNGAGDLTAETPGLGPLAARVAVLDGSFTVAGTAGWGSQLQIVLPLDAASPALNVAEVGQLTPREREVLTLLAEGARNRAIGTALTISENTVKFHVANLLHKTGTTSRAQLLALVANSAG